MREQERQELYKNILDFFGDKRHCSVVLEELSEMIQDIFRKIRITKDPEIKQNLMEEVLDTCITLEQLKTVIDLSEDNIGAVLVAKLDLNKARESQLV